MPPRTKQEPEPEQRVALPGEEYPDLTNVTVWQALTAVRREIGPIAKDKRVKEGGGPKFNFRGIDDVLNAVHGPMARWGLTIAPTGWDQVESSVGQTKSGTTQLHVRARVEFSVVGPNGDHGMTLVAPGEALDLSDKAASKAQSMAYKYAVIQALAIPVEAGALDESDQASVNYEQPPSVDTAAVWAKYDEAIATLGLDREKASAKWRGENGGITQEQMEALPIEQVFGHIRSVVNYAKQHEKQLAEAEAGQPDTPSTGEDA